jgi:hypothetical protein
VPTKTSIPPPSTGYWAWVRDELRVKADEKWVTSELSALRRMFDDTKSTATDARKAAERPYVCMQEKEIEKMKTWQEKVTNWKIPIIISIVILIISAAGQYFSLKDGVEDGNQARAEIQETLKKIEAKQEETSKIVDEIKQRDKRNEETRKKDLRDLLKEIVSEKKETAPTRHVRTARGE